MMYYDRVTHYPLGPSGISCGFRQFRAALRDESLHITARTHGMSVERLLWTKLCTLLTASEQCSVLTPVTDLESTWRDYLMMCPYVDFVAQNRSQHGNYQAYIFVVHKHKRPKECNASS